jgi:drug/metabolite transporter (DMT)-like permease
MPGYHRRMAAPTDRRVLLAFVVVVALGGTNLVLVVHVTRHLDPLWGAGLRFTGAAILALIAMAAIRQTLPKGRDLVVSTVYGILSFALGFGLFFWGTRQVPAGVASVIMGLVPLLTLLLAVAQRLERFRVRGLYGAVLALLGIAVISARPPSGSLPILSLLAVVGAATVSAQSAITVRRISDARPLPVNVVGMSVGAVLLLAGAIATGESLEAPSTVGVAAALAVMIVTSPLLFVLYVYVVQQWSASAAAYELVLFPLVSIPLSAVLLDERISASLLLGAPLVLLGVWVGALTPDRSALEPEPLLPTGTVQVRVEPPPRDSD